MGYTQTFVSTLTVLNCANCGIAFGITSDFEKRRRDDHEGFFCPKGHSNVFNGKSEADKLKDRLKEKEESIEWYSKRVTGLHTEITKKNHEIRAQKAAKTKILNRVKNGICPCCNRTFQDLQKHFKSKHPELL